MVIDLARPDGCDRVVPVIDSAAVILAISVTRRQVELDDACLAVGYDLRTNLPAQFGEIGFLFSLARDQDQVGGVDRTDGFQRQPFRVAATDADQSKRKHGWP